MDYINKVKGIISRPLLPVEVAGIILIIFAVVNGYNIATGGKYIVFSSYGPIALIIIAGVLLLFKNIIVWAAILFYLLHHFLFVSFFSIIFLFCALLYFISIPSTGDTEGLNYFHVIYFYVSICYYFLLSDEIIESFKLQSISWLLKIVRGFAFVSASSCALYYGFYWLQF